MFKDKTMVCKDCGQEFSFTASEQEFYAQKGFSNEPQRCKTCRSARKAGSAGGRGGRSAGGSSANRPTYDAVCASCGKACKVPFAPRNDRPIYCSDCFRK